jgi:hypothetical protein
LKLRLDSIISSGVFFAGEFLFMLQSTTFWTGDKVGVVLFGVVVLLHLFVFCIIFHHLYVLYLWLSFIIYFLIKKNQIKSNIEEKKLKKACYSRYILKA